MNALHSHRGFTLIETIVYIAIFVTVSIASVSLLFSLQELTTQYRVKQALLVSGSAVLERTLLEVREAWSVVESESILASTTAAVLTLEIAAVSGTTTAQIEWVGDVVQLVLPTGTQQLQRDDVRVDAVTFSAYEANGVEFVRVQLTVSATQRGYTESLTLQGGAIIRGSYVSS